VAAWADVAGRFPRGRFLGMKRPQFMPNTMPMVACSVAALPVVWGSLEPWKVVSLPARRDGQRAIRLRVRLLAREHLVALRRGWSSRVAGLPGEADSKHFETRRIAHDCDLLERDPCRTLASSQPVADSLLCHRPKPDNSSE
jgi:hypothetical protein